MHYLVQTGEDIATIVSEMSELGDHRGPRHLLTHEQMQAHATSNGMVMVFVENLGGQIQRRRIKNVAEAALLREVNRLAENYRKIIRDDLPTGQNLVVKAALSRVRAQEKFLAGLDMADQSEACELLGLSKANPSATLKRIEGRGELIRIERDSRPMYPLFQFDTEARRIYPAMLEINRLRPANWSNIRLCYWMTRAHADFARAPAELLGEGDEEIIDAFRRAIEPETQG